MSRGNSSEQLLIEHGPMDISGLKLGTVTATAGNYYHQTQIYNFLCKCPY